MIYLLCSESVANMNFFLQQRRTQQLSWSRKEREGNIGKPKSWVPSSCSSTPAEIKNTTCSHATSSKNAHSYSQKHFFALFPLTQNNSHFPTCVLYCSFSRCPLPLCCSQAAPVNASHASHDCTACWEQPLYSALPPRPPSGTLCGSRHSKLIKPCTSVVQRALLLIVQHYQTTELYGSLTRRSQKSLLNFPLAAKVHSANSLHISSKKQLDMMILKVLVNLNNSLILRSPN